MTITYAFGVVFFPLGFLSQTLTIHRTAGEVRGPCFISLYHFHPLTNIETFICNFACKITITYFCVYQAVLDEIYHLIELPFEWLFDDSMFVCLLDELILGLSYSDLTWETGGLELVSTITPVLLANRLTKCASHPKCANWCPHFWPIISSYLHSHFFDVEQVIIHYGCFEKIFVQVLPKRYKPERWYMI